MRNCGDEMLHVVDYDRQQHSMQEMQESFFLLFKPMLILLNIPKLMPVLILQIEGKYCFFDST